MDRCFIIADENFTGKFMETPPTESMGLETDYFTPHSNSSFLNRLICERSDALIIDFSLSMRIILDLMFQLELHNFYPAILAFLCSTGGEIIYTISDNDLLPCSENLAVFLKSVFSDRKCIRKNYRPTACATGSHETINIFSEHQSALNELLLGCSPTEIQFLRNHYKLDLRDNGYYLFFWEISISSHEGHSKYKSIYNLIGQNIKNQCEDILSNYNGGEVFFLSLTHLCIIINDIQIKSESQRKHKLHMLIRQLCSIAGTDHSIRYLSRRTSSAVEFCMLYDTYLEERNLSFFMKDKPFIESQSLAESKYLSEMASVNKILDDIVLYITHDISNSQLDYTLQCLFFEHLKHSLNIPLYCFCVSSLATAFSKTCGSNVLVNAINLLNNDHLRHSSIESEYKKIVDIVQEFRSMLVNKAPTRNALLIKAIEYIRKNYHRDIKVYDIASELFITPQYLGRLFRKELNTSVIQYLTYCRITRAKHLLENTDDCIYTVAWRTGFNDSRYFSKTFKLQTGYTPREYRNRLYSTTKN